MLSSGKKKAVSSLRELRRRIAVEAPPCLQSVLLLQMLMGLSQTLNGSVSQSQALARTLLLNGQQRLSELLGAAPRLHLPVEQALQVCQSAEADDAECTPEESAVRALLEMCLGLMLKWLVKGDRQPAAAVPLSMQQRMLPSCIPSSTSTRLLKIRSCPRIPLA